MSESLNECVHGDSITECRQVVGIVNCIMYADVSTKSMPVPAVAYVWAPDHVPWPWTDAPDERGGIRGQVGLCCQGLVLGDDLARDGLCLISL